mgnify:CR=1 FL=1
MAYGETPATGTPQGRPPAPLPSEGFGSLDFWKDQITAAEAKIQRYAPAWKQNVQRQIGTPLEIAPKTDIVVVPLDHANIEQKKATIYFRNPEVQLVAAPGHDASADALQAFSVVLNEYLGPDGVDAETMADELLTDVLCPSGIGFSVIGLDVATDGVRPVEVGQRAVPAVGAVLNLQPVMEPIIEQVPNIIHQRYFWSRVSPLCGLLPTRFHGRNFDRAPWLGYKFEMDRARAVTAFGLTDDEAAAAGGEVPDRLNALETQTVRDTDVVYGYCVSYQGSLYNPAVKHPEEIWRLMLIKGVDRVVKHDRPYQTYTPDGMTLLGMRGHFIHVYTPRYVSDSAIVPSDVSITRVPVGELEKGRTQMVQQRDRNRPMRQMNISSLDPGQQEKVKRGEWQEILLTTSNEPIVQEVATARFPRENFEFNAVITKDIDRAWGFGDPQRGVSPDTRRTATELSLQASSSDTRMEKERAWFLRWYLRGAEKLAGLIQLYEDDRTMVQIAGDANTQRIVAWQKEALPLRFQCKASLDTMIRMDTAREFKNDLEFYQMTANDPNVNRVELLTQMARKRGYDVSKVIVRQVPEKGPDPPKIALTVTGEDLNPLAPQFTNIQRVLAAGGIQLPAAPPTDPMAGAAGLPPDPALDTTHGGPAEQVEPLSKRSGDASGKLDGLGMAGAVN